MILSTAAVGRRVWSVRGERTVNREENREQFGCSGNQGLASARAGLSYGWLGEGAEPALVLDTN